METTEPTAPGPNRRSWWIAGGIAAAVLLLLLVVFLLNNSVTNAGNQKEARLNAQYNDNFNYLSDCVVRIRESAGVVRGQTEALDQVLEDAVKGRYEGNSSAEPGGNGQLFSAMVEAYPDLSSLSGSFDKVLTVVNGCRTDYRDMQSKMQKMIADFESWRTGSFFVRTFGGEFPNDNLRAKKGDTVLRGDDALVQMETVIVVREATRAQETGEIEAEDPFDTGEPE